MSGPKVSGGGGPWGDVWVLLGQPRAPGKAPPTFQGPLWVGQPGEGGSLGEAPPDPLLRVGSFVDLWWWRRVAEAGVLGTPRPAWAWVGRGGAAAIPQDPEAPEGSHGRAGVRKQRQTVLGVSTRCKKNPTH